jgi:membrane protein DedA with SNARE-associated domain
LLLAHFIGHVRSFVAITAGMSQLSYRRYQCYEVVAAIAWNLVWVLAGYLVGANLGTLQRLASGAGVVLLLVVALGYLVFRRVRQPAREAASLDS